MLIAWFGIVLVGNVGEGSRYVGDFFEDVILKDSLDIEFCMNFAVCTMKNVLLPNYLKLLSKTYHKLKGLIEALSGFF